jgi:hypothetical protein
LVRLWRGCSHSCSGNSTIRHRRYRKGVVGHAGRLLLLQLPFRRSNVVRRKANRPGPSRTGRRVRAGSDVIKLFGVVIRMSNCNIRSYTNYSVLNEMIQNE